MALLDIFGRKLRAKEALANRVNLAQGSKSVREYAAKFELNTRCLDSSDEATLIQFFIWGLHRDIAERLSITHPISLSQAIAMVEEIELVAKFSRRHPVRLLPMLNRVVIIVVEKLVEFVWGIPLGETQKDAGDEEVDAVVDPWLGNLVVLKNPNTHHKGRRQQITILKAW